MAATKKATKKQAKRARSKKYRSAKSGEYTSKGYAKRHPSTTVAESH